MKQKEFVVRMFGDAITERMQELEMTKTDLARAAEISLSTLQRALEGRSVRMDTIVSICQALEVNDDRDFWETDYYKPALDRI
jgi:predicted transcriptional regulator